MKRAEQKGETMSEQSDARPVRKAILVRSDDAGGYAARGYTFLTAMFRGGDWYTLMQEPEPEAWFPRAYPPRTSSGLLEED